MTSTSTYANELICFDNLESAKKMAADLQFTKEQEKFLIEKYGFCDKERKILAEQKENLQVEVEALKSDVGVLKEATEEYKQNYVQTNEQLLKEQQSKPSRMTWFGVGFVSALVSAIFLAF